MTGTRAGALIVWDVETGEELRRLRGDGDVCFYVTNAAFTPDGSRLLAEYGNVRVLSGAVVQWLHGSLPELSSAALSPDGRRIVLARPYETDLRSKFA